jgi:uncharacterized RDD family membrane protein YckC
MNTYASLWQRIFAQVIDYLFFCMLFFPVARIIKGTWLMYAADHDWRWDWIVFDPICLAFLIFIFTYFIVLESLFGQTIGKKLTGIRVIRSDGSKPGFKAGLIRNILRLVDGLPVLQLLGITLIIITDEKTRFGDIVAKTRVVKIR